MYHDPVVVHDLSAGAMWLPWMHVRACFRDKFARRTEEKHINHRRRHMYDCTYVWTDHRSIDPWAVPTHEAGASRVPIRSIHFMSNTNSNMELAPALRTTHACMDRIIKSEELRSILHVDMHARHDACIDLTATVESSTSSHTPSNRIESSLTYSTWLRACAMGVLRAAAKLPSVGTQICGARSWISNTTTS
jgi:hypothetical protein